jgi:ribosomal protein S18 acetylase RimI-like enzyme
MDLETNLIIRMYQHPADYAAVYKVWENAGKGIRISLSDKLTEIEKLIHFSPGLFFVGEINHQIIGTAMGGFDGRRGLIYHLAVLPEFQKHHIGSKLLQKVEEELIKKGCIKVYLFITPENIDLTDFYNKHGYQRMDVIPLTKYLGEQ